MLLFRKSDKGFNQNQRVFLHTINNTKEIFIAAEHLVVPVPPYFPIKRREYINVVFLRNTLAIHMVKPVIEVPLQW